MTRDCDHDSTHGIARRSSTDDVCFREDGREPMLSSPISATGVEVVKYSMNPGSECTSDPYASRPSVASSAITP